MNNNEIKNNSRVKNNFKKNKKKLKKSNKNLNCTLALSPEQSELEPPLRK